MAHLPPLSRDQLEAMASLGQHPGEVMVRKQFICDEIKAVPSGSTLGTDPTRQRTFIISTGKVDRDNDVVSVAGWNLTNYLKNPVVLWAHDYDSLPLARAVDVRIEGANLVATAEFADHEMANTVLRLIDGGFLRATSVGFRPESFTPNSERRGIDFKTQELLEFSIVPVPSNPDALIMRSAVEDDAALGQWAETVLTAWRGKGVWMAEKDATTLRAEAIDRIALVDVDTVKAALREVLAEDKAKLPQDPKKPGDPSDKPDADDAAGGDGIEIEPDADEEEQKANACCAKGCTEKATNVCVKCNHKSCGSHLKDGMCACHAEVQKSDDDEIMFDFDLVDAAENDEVSIPEIRSAIQLGIREFMRETVENETRATLDRLRGRVD